VKNHRPHAKSALVIPEESFSAEDPQQLKTKNAPKFD
jgi:hypothetical protein